MPRLPSSEDVFVALLRSPSPEPVVAAVATCYVHVVLVEAQVVRVIADPRGGCTRPIVAVRAHIVERAAKVVAKRGKVEVIGRVAERLGGNAGEGFAVVTIVIETSDSCRLRIVCSVGCLIGIEAATDGGFLFEPHTTFI